MVKWWKDTFKCIWSMLKYIANIVLHYFLHYVGWFYLSSWWIVFSVDVFILMI